MNKDDLIQELFHDLSVNMMATAQIIINSMHDERHIVRIQEVAICWLNMCPIMSQSEWMIGTRALIHYCEAMGSKASIEVVEILDQPEDLWIEYSRMLLGAEQRRGKNRNAGTFERSLALVKMSYLGFVQQIEK